MLLPKYNLLYFKELLDLAFIDFFNEYNDLFIKNENNEYCLVNKSSIQTIFNFFMKNITEKLNNIIQPFDLIKNPSYYIIIGGCQPKDNFLLNFKGSYFPDKLDFIIKDKQQLKYILKEKDIKIDIQMFNQICCDAFNAFFSEKNESIGKNVIFLAHKHLDCYSLFKIVKQIFGKSNCINVKDIEFNGISSPIVSVNNLIDKYINNKSLANKDIRLKRFFNEVNQYLQMRIGYEQ